jgi:hypothetical protein
MARIDGQLVADAGMETAKHAAELSQNVNDATGLIYPLYGVTVDLLHNGTVIATTTTDAYGRFQFTNLAPGDYEVSVNAGDAASARYHMIVNADQRVSVYGRVLAGTWQWNHEPGEYWEEMRTGAYWNGEFCGASPGPGYWYDGHRWQQPHSGGPGGPGGPHMR